ncbi:MAG: helix-turn-helix domain-containing protein, partial [Desulfocapsaceae bacterium]|nr:helix-turn-helix domain-containing protein [Desulfocapsaceae bacterium]
LIEVQDVTRALQLQESPSGDLAHASRVSSTVQDKDTGSGADGDLTASSGRLQFLVGKEKAAYEKHLIMKTLEECNGSRTRTARKLGISRTTLWRKLQQTAGT